MPRPRECFVDHRHPRAHAQGKSQDRMGISQSSCPSLALGWDINRDRSRGENHRARPRAVAFAVQVRSPCPSSPSPAARYYLVQRAREASVIGIVVGTLGVQRYAHVVRALREMIEGQGRKAYTLAVGKINVAKLANFAEVRGRGGTGERHPRDGRCLL